MTRVAAFLLAACVLSLPCGGQSQTLPAGNLSGAGGGGSAYPFNATADHTWQWHYDSAQFLAGPIQIVEVYVRILNNGQANPFNFGSVQLVMASSPTDYTIGGNGVQPGHDPTFANNLNPDATEVRPALPWSGAPAAGVWIPMGMVVPFVYDPTSGNDFVLQIRKCGTTATWGQSIFGTVCCPANIGTNGGNRYGSLSSCTATVQTTSNNEYVPIIMIDYVPVTVGLEYQVNQSAANLDVNAIQGTGAAPALVTVGVAQPFLVSFTSTAGGNPWDIGVGLAPLVPRSGGGIAYPDGQVLNLDVSDPSLTLLWNLFQSPGFVNLSFPASVPLAQTLSIQGAVYNPASPSGLSISQPTALTVQ